MQENWICHHQVETAPCTEDTNQASGKFRFCSEIKQQHTMSLKEESLTESQTGQFSVFCRFNWSLIIWRDLRKRIKEGYKSKKSEKGKMVMHCRNGDKGKYGNICLCLDLMLQSSSTRDGEIWQHEMGENRFYCFWQLLPEETVGKPSATKTEEFSQRGGGGSFCYPNLYCIFPLYWGNILPWKDAKKNANANVPRNPLYLFLEKRVPWRGSKAVWNFPENASVLVTLGFPKL